MSVVVPALRSELVDAVKRSSTSPSRHRRVAGRRLRLVMAIAILVALLGAAALAATGIIGDGEPLKPAPHTPHDPQSGLGVPKPGSGVLLPLRDADPDGGPAWGARFVATTRGLGCLQVGRVVDGKVGVLGQDWAFANDGRFHPLAVDYFGSGGPYGPFPCGVMDAKGHVFAQIYMHGIPASGLVIPNARQVGCLPAGIEHARGIVVHTCPARDWRTISAGMVGPDAVSVTYRTRTGLRTTRTSGPNGAYLIVKQVSSNRGLGDFSNSGGDVVRINYKDGTSCRIRPLLPAPEACARRGRVEPSAPRATAAEVRAPVSARIGNGHFGRTVVVSFVARRGIDDASSAYAMELQFSGPQVNCRARTGSPVLRNVRAGERVSFHQPTNGCRGVFHGTVRYYQGLAKSAGPVFTPTDDSLVVGHFTVDGR